MGTPVITCLPADWDAVNGTCANPVWVEVSLGILPPLSIADGTLIGLSLASACAVAWVGRALLKFLAPKIG